VNDIATVDTFLTKIIGLLVVAILVALIARRLKLPYTVGLVLTGIGLAISPVHVETILTHDLVFDVILPPLLFEAAINIHWTDLRRDAFPILILAVIGTILAAAVVATGLIWLLEWPLRPALLFGVLIAATDPVAVIAMFKDNGVGGRLRLLVESESLLNDGVAAVLFSLVLAWAMATGGATVTPSEVGSALLQTIGGGVLAGLLCAGGAIIVAGRTSDRMVESTLTVVAAYGSFLLAEHFHGSGVLATVTAGLLMGNLGILLQEERGRASLWGHGFTLALWEFIAFIANSLIFLLIGLTVAGIAFKQLGARSLIVILVLVLISRGLTVYPLCASFMRSRWAISFHAQHVLWWGGLRGALGLALALSLDPSVPFRNHILVGTFGVVVFSVVLQGLTMPLLLRRSRSNDQRDHASGAPSG
jgi:monovalent cation:H+ antiporter, CPA1 family